MAHDVSPGSDNLNATSSVRDGRFLFPPAELGLYTDTTRGLRPGLSSFVLSGLVPLQGVVFAFYGGFFVLPLVVGQIQRDEDFLLPMSRR
jgi:hypothetical protein